MPTKNRRLPKTSTMALLLALVFAVLGGYFLRGGLIDRPHYTGSGVFERLVKVKELAVLQYNYTAVAGLRDQKNLGNVPLPFTDKHFLVQFDGYLKAGVDLEQVSVEVKERTATVHLPKARLLENKADEKSVIVYDESMNILNQVNIRDYNQAVIAQKEAMEQKALDNGFLEDADRQAKQVIELFLREMGFETISILSAKP